MNKTEIHLRPLTVCQIMRLPAYERGFDAGAEGKTFNDCPARYAQGSHQECAWAMGFVHGRDSRDAAAAKSQG